LPPDSQFLSRISVFFLLIAALATSLVLEPIIEISNDRETDRMSDRRSGLSSNRERTTQSAGHMSERSRTPREVLRSWFPFNY